MAKVRTSFNISRDFEKQFAKLGGQVIKDIQKGFKTLRDEVGKDINEAVEQHNDILIPSINDAIELGVGEGGSVDSTKTQNAWRQLLVNPPGLAGDARPTVFSVRKLKSKTGIGTIRVTIDENKLYRAPLSIVETESEINEPDFPNSVIPWLMWFIKGKGISGSKFTSNPKRGANLEVSRTGRGIMIRGGFWDFPQGENPFPLIQQAIEQLIVETVERYIEKQL